MTKKTRILGGVVAILWTLLSIAFALLAAGLSRVGDGSTSGLPPAAGYVVITLPLYFIVSAIFLLAPVSLLAARYVGIAANVLLVPALVILTRDGAWWITALAMVMIPFWVHRCLRGDDPPPIDWLDPTTRRKVLSRSRAKPSA